ncbi:MAG: DEAD/DEAH box helicase family protein [Prevotellaceae bacterium]|nr:DEAD/DEAH box helicase family protein [Prevotellaceae bacterium]
MMNFDYLKDLEGFEKVYNYCYLVEQYQAINPELSAQNGRLALESMVKLIYELKQWETPADNTLYAMTTDSRFVDFINSDDTMKRIHYIRKVGNIAMHPDSTQKIRGGQSFFVLLNLYYFVGSVMKAWQVIGEIPVFNRNLIPQTAQQAGVGLHVSTLAADVAQVTTDAAQRASATVTAEAPQTIAIEQPTELTEAETRKLYIDMLLEEAGWKVSDTKGAIENGKACIEVEVNGMPTASGKGYADYVLYGDNGMPLAVVEAKRTSVDPDAGRQQAELYAGCLVNRYGCERPVIYTTNGFSTNIIDGIYPKRRMMGYHTQEELKLLISRRNRKGMEDLTIKDEITDRLYQKRAIKSVCRHFDTLHRRSLLVMATGTGKTRVSISIVDVMVRNKWAKKILFLADRVELVTQAKRNFEKLLPDQTCSVLMAKDNDKNARILFSTYQTMINCLNGDDKEFSVGRFDLIIIDEAHRSIFGKYGAIFDYFDSLLLGLTATPRDEVDRSTYDLFEMMPGMPTDSYEYDEAVANGHLVPYKAKQIKSKIICTGIDVDKLSQTEKQELQKIFEYEKTKRGLDGDYERDIQPSEIFSYVYNKDTVDKVITNLMKNGIRIKDDTIVGKTIIFAYNHNHAMLIAERFGVLYPDLGTGFCRVIDNYEKYAESLLDDFRTPDKEPQIAVSVDMLDTGIDVPEILNLVFFKPVRSKIKFWQMIGRGTRLCKNIFGQGKDKTEFKIFDHWNNFDYFKMNSEGSEGVRMISVLERLFRLRVDIKVALQAAEYQTNPETKAFHDGLVDMLVGQVNRLSRARIDVRKVIKDVDTYASKNNWTALTPIQAEDIKDNIGPLLVEKADDVAALKFDAIVLKLQLSLVDTTTKAGKCKENIVNIARLLTEKATIPQVRQRLDTLNLVQTDEFWDGVTIDRLEKVRKEIRDLVQYLIETADNKTFTVNINDIIDEDPSSSTAPVIKTYRQRVMEYLDEHLEDNAIIQKIYNLEQLTEEDIRTLERIFWNELGTQDEYNEDTRTNPFCVNVAAFIRSLSGIDKEKALQKYRELINGAELTRMQEEYLRTIIGYVCEKGDIRRDILVNRQPFTNFKVPQIFGSSARMVVEYVDMIHKIIS